MAKGLDYLINLKDGTFSGAKNAKSELHGLDNAVDRTGKGMSSLGSIARSVGGLLIASFAVSEVFSFANASVTAFKEVEMAAAQVNQGIISTGGAAGRSIGDMVDQANKLENTTLFGDDQILGAQSLLVTFTKIKGAVFDQAIPAIADMAQRMGGDLKGASIQVGKALNDPIKGITALSRVGVSFTQQQKAQIESMATHNNLAGAQALILKELNTEFGGSAKAARDAAGGKADLAVATDNLREGFGKLLSTGLEPFYKIMTSVVTVIGENIGLITTLAVELGTAAGVYALVTVGMGLYTTWQTAAAAATTGMTFATWAWNAALYANPVGAVVLGVAALVGWFTIAYKTSETFRAKIAGLVEVGKLLGDVFLGAGKIILGALSFNPGLFMEGVKQSMKVAREIAGGGLDEAYYKGFGKSLMKEKGSTVDDLITPPKPKVNDGPGGTNKPSGTTDTSLSTNRQVRNVNVTIGKLVESLTIATTNLQGTGPGDLKRMITEILTGAVHDSELALSSE